MSARRRPSPSPLLIVSIVAAIAAIWISWHKVVRHQLMPDNFGVVESDRVYRSAQLTPRMLRAVISDHDIRTIIALNGDDEESIREAEISEELGVRRFSFNLIGDGTGDPTAYADVVRLMSEPENQPVLVHCAAGAQRTTTATLLYRHLVHGESISDNYPKMFRYDHKPGEWVLLAYLVDHLSEIEAHFDQSDAAMIALGTLPARSEPAPVTAPVSGNDAPAQ